MGRYGLVTPNSIFHDLATETNFDSIPPRFVRVKIQSPGNGTLATPWVGTFFLSAEATQGTTYGLINWDIIIPAAPDDILRVVALIHSEEFPPPFTPNVYFTSWLEFHHNGTLMGHTPFDRLGNAFVVGAYSGFQDLTNPALWGFNSNALLETPLWADVPFYHPYRR